MKARILSVSGHYKSTFEKSELGRIKKLLSFREMAESFGQTRKSLRPRLGRRSFFTPEGKVVLMFLKMYTGLSCPEAAVGGDREELRYDVRVELSIGAPSSPDKVH